MNIYYRKIFYKQIDIFINQNNQMQAQVDPVLQIIPFDDKLAVKAELAVEKQSRKLFMMKSFMMFVLQIRSAMDEDDIKTLKIFILDTCQQLIQRGGIDGIGFVINKNYHTIRNPNYQGIKDLLNAHIKVEDTTDIRDTIICLRNSIQLQAKKLQNAKISIFMFSSNVAENPQIPMKRTYRLKKNRHIYNYQKQVERLSKTISAYCDSCYFYSIGYMKKFGNNKEEKEFGWLGCADYDKQGIDISLLYSVSRICRRKQFTFNVCDSYTQLRQKFRQVSALILYEFHQFSLMVPVRQTKKFTFNPQLGEDDLLKDLKENKSQQMQEQEDINDQQLQEYFKKHKQQIAQQDLEQQLQEQSDEQLQYLVKGLNNKDIKYVKLDLTNKDQTKFSTQKFTYFDKTQLNLEQIHQNGYHLFNKVDNKKQYKFPQKKRIIKKMAYTYTPQYVSNKVNYHQPNSIQLITLQSDYYKEQLSDIICQLRKDILSYKKRFIGTYKKTKIFQTYLQVNQALQHKLRQRLFYITQTVKQMYDKIFKDELIRNQKQKRKMYQCYTSIKTMIDTTNEVFLSINKQQIKNEDIGKLSAALNYDKIKSSLKRKLIKRVNANPKMLDDVYDRVQQICSKQLGSFVDLQAKYREQKSEVGNCMYTFRNFATSLKSRDCLGVVFQIQRPDAAIADPGRIRIRQVSTLISGVSKFFQVHQYMIKTDYQTSIDFAINNLICNLKDTKSKPSYNYCPLCREECKIIVLNNIVDAVTKIFDEEGMEQQSKVNKMRQTVKFGIQKSDYKQNWDYWNRVESKQTFFGIMPLYICDQNWKVAKQLMKPCLGWTAAAEPLGYTYSQTQTIPFMVLSSLIRAVQETTYKISELQQECTRVKIQQKYKIEHQVNLLKHKRQRHEQLLKHVELTCQAIVRDMSGANQQNPFNKQIIQKYQNYVEPINRTIDVVNNNSSFISQIYTVIKLKMMEKPTQQKFHQFFKRLIQEQLRRQTDGWNQQQVQDKFVNKLLNVKVQEMNKPEYHVMDSVYLDKFQQAQLGGNVYRTQFQIHRQQLQMIIKEDNKFNDTQRMSIIQYKRLYENRVLWLWYVRFRLYSQKNRRQIHKWKSLNLTNSYQLFAMIIQNKKQRKNWKRREQILNGNYVDPFDYYKARQYLEGEFIRMRNKKQAKNIILLNAEKYGKASKVFAMTKDLREAAGAIMNIAVGKQINYYYQQLMNQSSFIEQKLKMILNGQFLGVTLFKHGWKMSRKRMEKLRNRYRYEFQRYQYMF